ncbi:IS3 family transposase [Salinispora arenicola]|uniref:IS3 family transposase n=1 Tax=Salinispora arenicola TaxID=168697 RepID=UPI0027DD59A6|nr:IS3 family transposase [Salinispora arenicola]
MITRLPVPAAASCGVGRAGRWGARKIWHEPRRRDVPVARCTVERLMRESGLRGLLHDTSPRTTRPSAETSRPADLVKRDFIAEHPNQLWVADLTYVRTSVAGCTPRSLSMCSPA